MPIGVDFSGLIKRLSNTGTFTVTRAAGSWVSGRYVAGTPATFQIVASIQVAQGRDLLTLPEGLRNKEIIVIFTSTQLQTAKALSPSNDADQITYNSNVFEVLTAEDRSGPGNYYRCLAKKMGQ